MLATQLWKQPIKIQEHAVLTTERHKGNRTPKARGARTQSKEGGSQEGRSRGGGGTGVMRVSIRQKTNLLTSVHCIFP